MNDSEQVKPTPKQAPIKKIMAILTWSFFWPVTMIVIGVLIIAAALHLLTTAFADSTPSGTELRAFFLIFIVVMVVLCVIFQKLHQRSKYEFVRSGKPVLRLYMWLGVVLGSIILVSIPDPTTATKAGISTQTASTTTVPELMHDPSIVATLHQVGATHIDTIDEIYVDSFEGRVSIIH